MQGLVFIAIKCPPVSVDTRVIRLSWDTFRQTLDNRRAFALAKTGSPWFDNAVYFTGFAWLFIESSDGQAEDFTNHYKASDSCSLVTFWF